MFFGGLLAFTAIMLLFTNWILSIVLLFASIVVFTTHYRLAINLEDKTFQDYVWVLGMKMGGIEDFKSIEYLFIKKNQVSQTMHLKVASSTVRKDVYDAYIKFSETQKIHLLTADKKRTLLERLGPIAKNLNIKMIDYSEGEAQEIL
jgi:hypothetical protein